MLSKFGFIIPLLPTVLQSRHGLRLGNHPFGIPIRLGISTRANHCWTNFLECFTKTVFQAFVKIEVALNPIPPSLPTDSELNLHFSLMVLTPTDLTKQLIIISSG